jgi:Haem-binding domain
VRIARRIALGLLAFLVILQLVPYGRDHADPRATRELRFDSSRTAELFTAACGACHSDRTKWPWYSNVAPVSFLVYRDVDEGRGILNVSEWDKPQADLEEVLDEVLEGGMPPLQYKLIHGEARLTGREKADLAQGLRRSWAADPPGG